MLRVRARVLQGVHICQTFKQTVRARHERPISGLDQLLERARSVQSVCYVMLCVVSGGVGGLA